MDRRPEIYEKAMALFAERGYDNTPMSLVSKTLGMSKAGIYHYFPSKEHLLFRIHEYYMHTKLIPVLDEAEKISDPIERISYFVRKDIEILVSNDAGRLLIREAPRLSPENYDLIKGIWRRVFDLVRNAIKELDRAGRIKKLNHNFVAFAAIGMMGWVIYWFHNTGNESTESLADCFIEIFFKGLLK